MIRVTGRTAPGPRTWAGSIWAGTARPTAAWSPSPRCGLMSGSTTRCTRCRTLRRSTSRRGRTTRSSGPSCRSGRILRSGPGRRGAASGRSSRTGPTGTRTGSAPSWGERGRLYGRGRGTGKSYKRVKEGGGGADSQARSDVATRRPRALVNCAFSFCGAAWFAEPPPQHDTAPQPGPGGGERGRRRRRTTAAGAVLAAGAARDPRLAFPLDRAAALVAGLVHGAPAPAAASPNQLVRGRLRPAPLHPELTDYR